MDSQFEAISAENNRRVIPFASFVLVIARRDGDGVGGATRQSRRQYAESEPAIFVEGVVRSFLSIFHFFSV